MVQSVVNQSLGLGVPGELLTNHPHSAESFIIHSSDPTNNVFGRACTVTSQGIAAVGGTGVFAGILANPKQNVLRGNPTDGPLGPSLTLANDEQADVVNMGVMVITLSTTANIGDVVIYDNVTGALEVIAPNASLPSGKSYAQAIVWMYTVSVAGLAVIKISPTYKIPT